MKKKWLIPLLLIGAVSLLSSCQKKEAHWETQDQNRVSIHDPSIIKVDENGEKKYYLFGTHLSEAKSSDLKTWQVPFTTEYENPEDNLVLGNLKKNLKESFKWAGYDDADSKGGYSIWAPDVFWNKDYVWKDGSKGAYMYYYSASSTWRRSCIGFAVSKTIEGQYDYRETIIYSGFSEKDSTDGSERNINYQNTNIPELIKGKKISGFSEKWTRKNGLEYNTDYAPNAIDPAIFTDAKGKMWMAYGSWSGGIFVLEMDEKTGLPKYPGKDSIKDSGQVVDRYFGTKVVGGFHQSGEGPYVVYDKDEDYYYLFVTYGGLLANGGYNMRLFRSKNPDGPYVDAKGNQSQLKKGEINDKYGIKLMGNYQFNDMNFAYKSEGHNSVLIDEDTWLLFYHTRFSNKGEGHEVRVHEMVMNEDQWPVVLPLEYNEKIKFNHQLDMTGTYELMMHGTTSDKKVNKSKQITLESDGKISGEVTGNWSLENHYLTFKIDEVTYKGVIGTQKDLNDKEQTVFSLIGNDNQTVWGIKSK